MNIVNVGYDSTNYYVLDSRPKLLIDIGFPGTLPKLRHRLDRMGLALAEIGHLICTHYHPDHAGLAEELRRAGVRLVVLDVQRPAVPMLGGLIKPELRYQPIQIQHALALPLAQSRAFLASQGVAGQIIATPGHSDDSVSVVLDTGEAFTGDLPPAPDLGGAVAQSWRAIAALGGRVAHPGHGPARPVIACFTDACL